MRFAVDPWDPAYGAAFEADLLDASGAEVREDVEVARSDWAPLRPPADPAGVVLFVDGVRRVEARVWIEDDDGGVHPGMCASFAAGVVRCDGVAAVGPVIVDRATFTTFGGAGRVATNAGDFPVRLSSSATPEGLALALQERMGAAEVKAAELACEQGDAELIVVDGPLRGRQHLARAVGYVKTHHVTYLPPDLHAIVGRMRAGERSPIFCVGTSWSRLSWYLRLPGDESTFAWSGVVRCECSADLSLTEAKELADRVSATLPRYASRAHKDPRAPQNLYPIAGLERELRRRLGDAQVLYRAIRAAARVAVAAQG